MTVFVFAVANSLGFLLPILPLFPMILLFRAVKRRRLKRIVVFSVILGLLILLVIGMFVLFPTRFPYCDMWIKGKTREEIISAYGEPDFSSDKIGYNVGYGTIGFDVYHNSDYYYYIEFDDNGLADEIYVAVQPGG